ncbi:DUF29 domain-containing protein [Desulfonema magnum]|uniref:DUF29 n=1 Tax=Desulfonema magnum TaxID=45655 RepID=A0A975BK97_9BACT|nr:DUF29 domain-containing protein [Desulfonema magnum]QTA86837.1 DUF29 [Desulfonema magnum]
MNPSEISQNIYEHDFCAWLDRNAGLLREGKLSEIDVENIAEELETMGKSQHRELVSRLKILFAHLLKWQFEPRYRSKSWKGTIIEQRQQIRGLLETSPSLKHGIDEKLTRAYADAVEYAANETGIPEADFPEICPYSLEQGLDKNFYPD